MLRPIGVMRRTVLLCCGIAAAVLYIAMTFLVGMLWDGYSWTSHTISELSAIGAPTRALWIVLGAIYTALFVAFGAIVWTSAASNRALRLVGACLLAQGVFGAFWPPMHQRTVLAVDGRTLTDTLHIVWTIATGVCFMVAMGAGAAAFGKRFRLYSIVTMAIVFVCGALTGTYAARIEANLPTPWAGVWERINSTGFMVWVAALAIALLRGSNVAATAEREKGARWIMSSLSAFKTREGEAAFLSAYDAALKLWPVPFDELDVPTRFGTTHVIVCGPKDAPPLVLLHGYMATSVMWLPNIADFSQAHRVYAIDVMGQPSKSIPGEPIRDRADFVAWLTETLDGLHLGRVSLVGMSFGGWVALGYAVAAPDRVHKLVLLSVGGFLPMSRQFTVRGILLMLWPTRFTLYSFMHWLGLKENPADPESHQLGDFVHLMHLGLKHFKMPQETARVMPTVFSDGELRSIQMPTLVLFGDREVICDPAAALARALRLIPDCRGELVPGPRHEMSATKHRLVDARVLEFLKAPASEKREGTRGRSAA